MQTDGEPISFFLLELPLEVITEVLKLLDWQTVLRVRQTCKHLSDATKAKSIWLGLFYASNASHSRSPLRLERPMELYTSRELEYLVLRRSSARIIRQRRTELFPPLTCRFPIDDLYVGALILITGGRWLLTASATGSVWYYDLDARAPVKRLLIPEQMEYLHGFSNGVRMVVDIDNKSSLLSFNLAMVMARTSASCVFYSNPNRSGLACKSPTRWPNSGGEPDSHAPVLFPSRKLRFFMLFFLAWEVHRLWSCNNWTVGCTLLCRVS